MKTAILNQAVGLSKMAIAGSIGSNLEAGTKMDFIIYLKHKGSDQLIPLGKVCVDWVAVRQVLKDRRRSTHEQLIVVHDGMIYAVERSDGNGFSMVPQDRQSEEDSYWYPKPSNQE